MSAVARAQGLGVRFVLDRHGRPVTPVMAALRRQCRETWALRGVDMTITPGQGLALIGRNGAGKSTLLRTLAGVIEPDEGTLEVTGRIGPLLSATGGMALELTGRENSALLGTLLGLTRAEVEGSLPAVERASGLDGDFDSPLSTYSSGMRARAAYSAVWETNRDLLLLDEVREVLDHDFKIAMEDHARALRARGGAIVAAGHDRDSLCRICDEALLLEAGHVVLRGPIDEVFECYLAGDVTPRTRVSAAPS